MSALSQNHVVSVIQSIPSPLIAPTVGYTDSLTGIERHHSDTKTMLVLHSLEQSR